MEPYHKEENMTKTYAVFNPSKGEYTYTNSELETLDILANNALEFYLLHSHNLPISVVIENEDGSSTWEPFEKNINDFISTDSIKEKYINLLINK